MWQAQRQTTAISPTNKGHSDTLPSPGQMPGGDPSGATGDRRGAGVGWGAGRSYGYPLTLAATHFSKVPPLPAWRRAQQINKTNVKPPRKAEQMIEAPKVYTDSRKRRDRLPVNPDRRFK